MVPLLLPCATTGLSSIAAWCGSGAPPRGQQWPPACTLPHVRDGLRVRSRATFCPCGRSSMRRPAHRQFLRNALPDLTTIAPVTAYYRINYVRDTVGITLVPVIGTLPAFTMAAFHVLVQWHGLPIDAHGFVPLSVAEFGLQGTNTIGEVL